MRGSRGGGARRRRRGYAVSRDQRAARGIVVRVDVHHRRAAHLRHLLELAIGHLRFGEHELAASTNGARVVERVGGGDGGGRVAALVDALALHILRAELLLQIFLARTFHLLHRRGLEISLVEGVRLREALLGHVVEPGRGFALKRNLRVVIDAADALRALHRLDTGRLELTLLLQRRQTTCLLELLLARFSLRLFTLGVGQPRASLREHLALVLVHIHRVRTSGLRLGIGVDLAGTKTPRIVRGVVVLVALRCGVEELLVPLRGRKGRGGSQKEGCARRPRDLGAGTTGEG